MESSIEENLYINKFYNKFAINGELNNQNNPFNDTKIILTKNTEKLIR